jgi:hypothetical protein
VCKPHAQAMRPLLSTEFELRLEEINRSTNMNDFNYNYLPPTTGWQITMIAVELIALSIFIYLLVRKFKSKNQYTHFEGKLYWASIIILLLNMVLYMYGH